MEVLATLLITFHTREFTCEYVRLLGPCFKTGQCTKANTIDTNATARQEYILLFTSLAT